MMTLKQRLYKLQFTIEFWRQEFSKLSSRGLSDVIEYMFNDYAYAAMREEIRDRRNILRKELTQLELAEKLLTKGRAVNLKTRLRSKHTR